MGPVHIAAHRNPETEAGDTLAELIHDGRDEEAEQLLVGATYDLFAGEDGGVEVSLDA